MTVRLSAPQSAPRIARRWLAEGTGPGHRRIGGSLLFADISGYTRLSERLAGRGRAGAEEAVTLIGGVLSAVTEAVESRGGDVLTFAGDAVIALFEGQDAPDSAGRAVDSAAAIRRWFDERARDTTTVGRVTLRAAVSVATGAYSISSSSVRTKMGLFVTGPTTTELVMLERAAGGGEVVIGPRTARAIGGIRRPVARGEGTLLPRTHSLMADLAAHEPELRDVDPPVDPRLIPTPMRAALAAGGLALESDHRLATMAFVVAGGIDARIAAAPAAVAAELDVLHRLVSSTAARHRVTLLGTDVTADGVALFLAAGAPVATGNDEERMLRTLRAVPCPTPSPSGFSSGPAPTEGRSSRGSSATAIERPIPRWATRPTWPHASPSVPNPGQIPAHDLGGALPLGHRVRRRGRTRVPPQGQGTPGHALPRRCRASGGNAFATGCRSSGASRKSG